MYGEYFNSINTMILIGSDLTITTNRLKSVFETVTASNYMLDRTILKNRNM